MFKPGDRVRVDFAKSNPHRSAWHGLVGTIKSRGEINKKLFYVIMDKEVPYAPHGNKHLLKLYPDKLKLIRREPKWRM